jgi:hypothetical protein
MKSLAPVPCSGAGAFLKPIGRALPYAIGRAHQEGQGHAKVAPTPAEFWSSAKIDYRNNIGQKQTDA